MKEPACQEPSVTTLHQAVAAIVLLVATAMPHRMAATSTMAQLAGHASVKTTQLYNRSGDKTSPRREGAVVGEEGDRQRQLLARHRKMGGSKMSDGGLPRWLFFSVLVGAAMFALWGIGVGFAWELLHVKHEYVGQWGDSFGPLTGLATSLALVFAIWSVNMQRHALADQLKEGRQTEEHQRAQLRAQSVANLLTIMSTQIEQLKLAEQIDLEGAILIQACTGSDRLSARLSWWAMVNDQRSELPDGHNAIYEHPVLAALRQSREALTRVNGELTKVAQDIDDPDLS